MSYEMLTSPVELTDDQLDFVAAGARNRARDSLVNAQVNVEDVNAVVAANVLAENIEQKFSDA
jgi:hypothetical protein